MALNALKLRIFLSLWISLIGTHSLMGVSYFSLNWKKTDTETTPRSQENQSTLLAHIIIECENNQLHRLYIEEEDGAAKYLVRKSHQDVMRFTFEKLTKEYVALAKSGSKEAVRIKCTQCSAKKGGLIDLQYLYNGISGSYQSKKIKLERDQEGFKIYTQEGKRIRRIIIKGRYIMGVLVGIKDLVFHAN